MLLWPGVDAFITKQPLIVTGALPVESYPASGSDVQAGQIGAHGGMHVQQQREIPAA